MESVRSKALLKHHPVLNRRTLDHKPNVIPMSYCGRNLITSFGMTFTKPLNGSNSSKNEVRPSLILVYPILFLLRLFRESISYPRFQKCDRSHVRIAWITQMFRILCSLASVIHFSRVRFMTFFDLLSIYSGPIFLTEVTGYLSRICLDK